MTMLVFKRRTEPLQRPEAEPEVVPKPVDTAMNRRMDEMLETMSGTLAYLQKTPKEQAVHEAGERQQVLEGELAMLKEESTVQIEHRGQLESEIAELKKELAPPQRNPKEMAKLRAMLREADADASVLRTRSTQHEQEIQALKQAGDKAEAEHQKSLAAARNQVPQIVQQMPGKPENIDFVYHRERNGLLSRVILKAEGYNDVEVGVVRGADGRMQQLKIGEA